MFRRFLAIVLATISIASGAPYPVRAKDFSEFDAIGIQMLTYTGRPEDAVEKAKAALATLRPADTPRKRDLSGWVLTFLCEALTELGKYRQAVAACQEAVATFEGNDDPRTNSESNKFVLALPQLASTYEAMREYELALDVRKEQLARIDDGRNSNPDKVALLGQIGELHLALGRFREAEAAYIEALTGFENVWHANRKALPLPHLHLATLYRLEERFDKAEAILKQGLVDLEATRKLMDEVPSARVAEQMYESNLPLMHQTLGWTYFHQGRLSEARDSAQATLDIYEREGVAEGRRASDVKILLARIEDAVNPGSARAESLLIDAVATPEDDLGITYVLHAIAQGELARHLLLAGRPVEAEPIAQQAADTLLWGLGEDSYQTARAQVILARAMRELGRTAEALAEARSALAMQQSFMPAYHSETGETLALLAELYEATGDRENLAAIETLRAEHRAARAKFEAEN
jgi:tetratricopeptide (TPR) repeat protein